MVMNGNEICGGAHFVVIQMLKYNAILLKCIYLFKKIGLPYDPEVLFLDVYLKEVKMLAGKKYTHPHVRCSIIYYSQDIEAT